MKKKVQGERLLGVTCPVVTEKSTRRRGKSNAEVRELHIYIAWFVGPEVTGGGPLVFSWAILEHIVRPTKAGGQAGR